MHGEREVLQWRDWYWGFKQYVLVVDGAYQDEADRIEGHLNTEADWDLLSKQKCSVAGSCTASWAGWCKVVWLG